MIPSSLAHTSATSATGALVIHILDPLSTKPPGTSLQPRCAWRPGVGAAVALGEPEAADDLAARHARQPPAALLLGAELVDRIHHERGLHAHRRAIAAVDRLDLAGDQPVSDVVDPGTAIRLRQRRPKEAQRPHLGHDLAIEPLLGPGADDTGQQLLPRIVPRRLRDHPLLLREARCQIERIVPLKRLLGLA